MGYWKSITHPGNMHVIHICKDSTCIQAIKSYKQKLATYSLITYIAMYEKTG